LMCIWMSLLEQPNRCNKFLESILSSLYHWTVCVRFLFALHQQCVCMYRMNMTYCGGARLNLSEDSSYPEVLCDFPAILDKCQDSTLH
jgi:hypothetical protein